MNKFLLCLVCITVSIIASPQKVYFVYLQSEQEQPFFVKMDERIYSSSASGYLILSKLKDSVYNFSVGFPQTKWAEQKFSVAVRSKDHGYLLKNFGDKGWGLFDLQTLAIQMAISDNKQTSLKTEKTDVSAFTDILAKAADDSTLREKPLIAKIEEKKIEEKIPEAKETESVKTEKIKDEETKTDISSKPIEKNEELKVEMKELPVAKQEEVKTDSIPLYKNSVITKQFENTTPEGISLSFTDEQQDGTKDTILILIPDSQPVIAPSKEQPREEKKFLDIPAVTRSNDTVVSPSPEIKKEVVAAKPVIRNTCKEIANESDFLKLRKKMVAETDDDDMVDEARKYLKTKCFTTTQIKNLGVLFLDDLGKYKFFEMAYIFASDPENFSSLQAELKNEYYVNRFKSILK